MEPADYEGCKWRCRLMENFNILADILLSFRIEVIKNKEDSIFIQRDAIVYKFASRKIQAHVNKAVLELINLDPAIAKQKVIYLRKLINEIAMIEQDDLIHAYDAFFQICSKHFITRDIPHVSDYQNPIISEIFINSLRYDISLRDQIITELEQAIEHLPLNIMDLTRWYDKNKLVVHKYSDGEIAALVEKERESYLITEQSIAHRLTPKQSITNIEGNSKPKKTTNAITSGFESYLNEPDLIKKLSSYKNLNNPKKITLMVLALKELGKLNCDPSYSGTALHRVLETSFGSIGVRQSISGNLKIYRNTPLSNDRKIEINEEKQRITNLISS
jgi:hypothetical protein